MPINVFLSIPCNKSIVCFIHKLAIIGMALRAIKTPYYLDSLYCALLFVTYCIINELQNDGVMVYCL